MTVWLERRNKVDKSQEARPCGPWPGVVILFKYIYNYYYLIGGL